MPLIRVLQLGSPTPLYGAERWILALIKHLDPAKIESLVAVIQDAPGQDAPLCREAAKLGFRSEVFSSFGKLNLSAVKLLRSFLVQNKIDILHTHGYKTDLIGLLATLGTSCKIVSTPHGWSKQADLKLLGYELLDRCAFPFFDAVVPLSQSLYTHLRRLPGLNGNLRLITNGVDLSDIDSVKDPAPELLGLKKEGAFIIGYVGRLVPPKGLHVLLDAASRLGFSNWHLAIVGEGESRALLEQQAKALGIADKVRFYGFREDRVSFLKGFDLFVLPSRSEGTPRCLMEAMAAGLPVIASDIPGCHYLVSHGQTGLLFPVDDAKALAGMIQEVASNKSASDRLAMAGMTFVKNCFSANRMADGYTSLYASFTSKVQSRWKKRSGAL